MTQREAYFCNLTLVRFSPDGSTVASVNRTKFESRCTKINCVHGRLICWILFSAGAEFLAKGACLVNGVEVRKSQPVNVPKVPDDSDYPLAVWRASLFDGTGVEDQVTSFGTLGDLTKKSTGHLHELCSKMGATLEEKSTLLAGYIFLQKAVRNRDAHAYVSNQRDGQFFLVEKLFVESFNILLRWLPARPTIHG